MNADDLLNIIGSTADKHVRDAHEPKTKRRKRQLFNLAIGAAACLVLAPTVLFGGMWLLFGGMGASAPMDGSGAAVNESGIYEFDAYEGPVLPLTTLESSEGIEASRKLDISFASFGDERSYPPSADLSDSYLLCNTTDADISLTALYPYAASIRELHEEDFVPELYIDGTLRSSTVAELICGPYSGSFAAPGSISDPEMASANLIGPSSFNDYVNLFDGSSYLEQSLSPAPELEYPITVYELGDYEYTSDSEATNPTLNFSYIADSSKTTVFTWNFNGGSNRDDGSYERHVGGIMIRPNASPENIYPKNAYIIVLGEDISDYSVQGYRNGGCKAGEELHDLGCSVKRYESTLGEMLRILIEDNMRCDTELLYTAAARQLLSYGSIGHEPATRYGWDMLDELVYDVYSQQRMAYLRFPVTVPAGGSISLEIRINKPASYNHYHGGGDGDPTLFGFDFATKLGSALRFTEQYASISDYEEIEIVSSNFGFDLESGETETLLDPNTQHYWLNVRKKTVEE
ncbi:MAG: hypothetical protein IJY96_02475 [Oscillospiraceae bacterium]|nr:hypothetical protein [Oscillospiraceae bacterium]